MDSFVLQELTTSLGDRLSVSAAVREHHGRDESPLPAVHPDAVAFPASEEEVAEILRICSSRRVPVIPYGAGTSLEGHVLAIVGGLCVDLSRLNRIVSVNISDLDVAVQAGVTRNQLDERLRRDGLFFPVDPGADATIGGMAATGASGTTTVRYGSMRHNVLSLRVVLPDGRIIRTGSRARKSSAGYDLTKLFVGSEGTLGILTEVTLRVYGIPETISAAICHFGSIASAVRAVITILQLGIPVARVELLDALAMAAVNDFSRLAYAVAPTLFFEFHGMPAGVAEQMEAVRDITAEAGAVQFRSAVDETERVRLWRARHDHFFASLALRPGARGITTDVCVPVSRLAECIVQTDRDIAESGVTATMAGHVGDGNFHVVLLVDPDDDEEMKAAEDLNARLVGRALAMEGTCTGEHGIGVRKVEFLEREKGEALVAMREIKQALDPFGIMNPGKVMRSVPSAWA